MADTKNLKQEIPAMYGDFNLLGVVESINTNNYSSTTQSGKEKRQISLTLRTSKDTTVNLNLTAFSQNEVYFTKKSDDPEKKNEQKVVAWDKRFDIKADSGWQPMSRVNIGVKRVKNDKGEEVVAGHYSILFDALQEVHDYTKEGDVLRIVGNVSVERYTNKNGEVANTVKLNPSTIYLSRTQNLDFEAEDFVETNNLNQTLIIQDIEVDEDGESAIITGLVIGNKKEGTMTFHVVGKDNVKFVDNNVRNNVEKYPYMSVKLSAKISSGAVVEEKMVQDDFWGGLVKQPRTRGAGGTKYYYTAIIQHSEDLETYTEENIAAFRNAFLRGEDEFGKNSAEVDAWGNI